MSPHCFNTQPPEGGCERATRTDKGVSRFNTQPPEGSCMPYPLIVKHPAKFQHTATRRWLRCINKLFTAWIMFQHTAARRRLPKNSLSTDAIIVVSTHSRPKAAAPTYLVPALSVMVFQHTAARRRLLLVLWKH